MNPLVRSRKGTDGIAGGEWDLSDLVVSDGDVSVPVYRKLTVDPVSNQLTFIAPFAYYPDAKDQSARDAPSSAT